MRSRTAVKPISGRGAAFYVRRRNPYQRLYTQYHWINLDANTRRLALFVSTVLMGLQRFNDGVYCEVYFGLLTSSEPSTWVMLFVMMGTNIRYEVNGGGIRPRLKLPFDHERSYEAVFEHSGKT